MKKNYKFSFFCFLFTILVGFNFISGDVSTVTKSYQYGWEFWIFLTNQSNAIALVYLLFFSLVGIGAIKSKKITNFIYDVKLPFFITCYLLLVFLVVAFDLEPVYTGDFYTFGSGELSTWTHNLTPLLVVFIFFTTKWQGKLYNKDIFLAPVYPLIYVIVIEIIAPYLKRTNGKLAYPYTFLNPNIVGGTGVIIIVVVLLILFLLLSWGIVKAYNNASKNID